MASLITSIQNSKIKEIAKYSKRRFRDARRETVVEGRKEIQMALSAGYAPSRLFICQELVDSTDETLVNQLRQHEAQRQTAVFDVSPEVYEKIAYRGASGGFLGIFPYVDVPVTEMSAEDDALILVIESPEKPGNLGALLRTADAAGFDGVVVCGEGTDLHNPNTIRASLGALFTLPVAQTDVDAVIQWLRENHFTLYPATPSATTRYDSVDMSGKTAIIVGNEAFGLSEKWLLSADTSITIPMRGKVDSLNLSASAAILMYEAVRQRGFG